MWPTIWPVLGTIASYYAHNKRQWGHAKVTLPARLAPLLPAQRGLTAGCTMHDRGKSERDGVCIASHRVPTQERARVCTCATPLTCNTRPRMHTKATQTVTNACSPCTWWGRVQASFGPENLPTFLVARANECTSVRRNFGGCTPILVGWTRTENLNLVQGSSARFAARMEARRSYVQPFSRRGWRRGRR